MSTIKETTLHPDGNEGVDLYPKTNINQVQELPQKLTSVENQINQLNIDKLTKPTNPSAESVVTMLADGTVGTKLLSEIGGGGKLYRHIVRAGISDETGGNLQITIFTSNNKNYVQNNFINFPEIYIFQSGICRNKDIKDFELWSAGENRGFRIYYSDNTDETILFSVLTTPPVIDMITEL